ncbi:NADPH-dependent FMN reductase [Janibacter sp. G56]|uniref:NADPH-dependent FMN reductase n=1 Tax=Janibacter sp. G56 TaxID=3418717 RepID=UPI003D025B7E
MTNIGIVITSTRPTRIGPKVATWIAAQAPEGVEVEIIDLAEQGLPFLSEPGMPKDGNYEQATTIAWSEKVSSLDGLIFATAEYNASFTAPLKNAIDHLFTEWEGKPVALVGYGWMGGSRAVEALKPVFGNVSAVVVDAPGLVFMDEISIDGDLTVNDETTAALAATFAELEAKVPATA